MKSLVIFGPPRSGTSWLATIFDSHPETLLRFQPLFSFSHQGSLESSSNPEDVERFLLNVISSKDEFATMKAQYFDSFPKFGKSKPRVLVIKETRYLNLARVFLSNPQTKVIGMLRDPLETLNSWFMAPKEFNRNWSIEDEWLEAKKKNSEQSGGFYGLKKWLEIAHEFEALSQTSERFELIRYDHLIREPENEVERISQWIGLDFRESTKAFLRESQSRWVDDPYSVFRGGAKTEWRLPEKVTNDALNYVTMSGFGHYLSKR